MLREQGDEDELRRRADRGSPAAVRELVKVLRDKGNIEGLDRRARNGDHAATRARMSVLRERDEPRKAEAVARRDFYAGKERSPSREAAALRDEGGIAGLSRPAETGDRHALRELEAAEEF